MLNELIVENENGNQLTFPLRVGKKSYRVFSFEGLGPVKASLSSSVFAQIDGSNFHSARRDVREIKFQIDLIPNYADETAFSLRQKLYTIFMPKSKVTLYFRDQNNSLYNIEGVVEVFEASLFSQENTIDVNIICFDPDFVDSSSYEITGNTTATLGGTEFEYRGSTNTGITFQMKPNRALTDLSIYHRSPTMVEVQMDYQGSIKAGDELIINTNVGEKNVLRTDWSNGYRYPSLHYLSPSSKWISLSPGTNLLRVYSEGAPVPYSIKYTPRYGGL